MTRELTVVQPLPPGDHAEAFRGDPGTWLPHARHAGPDRWRIHLRVGGVERAVACRVGDPWRTREGLQRRLVWTPLPEDADVLPVERFLPALDGELHLVGTPAGSSLALTGQVAVPLGAFGEAVDALVLGRVAQRGAARFLAEVGANLAAAAPTDDRHPSASGAHHRS